MTLFSDESTILDEASIDYDNKVAIHDYYGDDMYAIKNNHNHETCHHNFNSQYDYANQVSHDSYFVELAPTIMNEKECAYVESDTSPPYLLFQTLLTLFWTLTCMI